VTAPHPSEAREGMCRSCGAPILWAKTQQGRAIPLDLEPTADGNIEFTGVLDIVRVHAAPADGDLFGTATNRRRPHFATCPQADQWKTR
jgi:hypothetical protein